MWDLVLSEDVAGMAAMAARLGWSGLTVLVPAARLKEAKEAAACTQGIDVAIGVVLSALKAGKVGDAARAVRRSAVLVAVLGGDLDVNRAVCETPEVDVLLQPWGSGGERSDPGFNHVLAELAARNKVAVAFTIGELATAQRKQRAMAYGFAQEVAKLVRKARGPFVLASGAEEPWELRGPAEVAALGSALGFLSPAVATALHGTVVAENRKRLAGRWIGPGVEME